MSNKTNYSRFAGQQAEEQPEVKSVVEPGAENTVVPEVEAVTEPVEETPVAKPVKEEVKVKTGVVTGCAKLRVRKKPSTDASVLCELKAGTEVTVDNNGSTSDFYKVKTAAGAEGYCMKTYITLK